MGEKKRTRGNRQGVNERERELAKYIIGLYKYTTMKPLIWNNSYIPMKEEKLFPVMRKRK